MQTTEINGFVIDTFNQHGLKEGASQGICPLCSHTRKPKNQKAQCASYDWERGLGTCHNCDTSFQLHTYQRKGASEKVYIRPTEPANFNEVSTNVETWFGTRGISKQTLKDLQVTDKIKITPLLVLTGYGKMQVLNDKKISRLPDFKTAVKNILNNSLHDHI